MNKYLIVTTIIIFTAINAWSQEILIDCENPFLQKYSKEYFKNNIQTKSTIIDTLEIPFFDDFSRLTVYPASTLWMDKFALINDNYAEAPISIGVATLDAIDEFGKVYDHLDAITPKIADYLTSKPINLKYTANDSIYLSFFYQAGGLSNPPEFQDSLVLQIKTPDSDWKSIWKAVGDGKVMTNFKPVIISIDNPDYLKKGFQFRFLNYATISSNYEPSWKSNADIWNIDYVYIDKNRSYADTLARDIAFVKNLESIINNYEAVPWRHYKEYGNRRNLMTDSIIFLYKNSWEVVNSVGRSFFINDFYNLTGVCNSPNYTWENIQPFETYRHAISISQICNIPINESDSAKFELMGHIATDSDEERYRWNDTIRYYQTFDNYYAYDDGTAEAGYGILEARSSLAYKFEPLISDTLKGVYIYFNHVHGDGNVKEFTLTVWDDSNGKPGNILYKKEEQLPQYADSLNAFVFYSIDEKVIVNSSFYVGWHKVSKDMLNCGFDLNRVSNDKLFFNVSGQWVGSSIKGALMMRPVFGRVPKDNNISNIIAESDYNIYPNPATTNLHILSSDEYDYYEMYDATGKLLLSDKYTENIDIAMLNSGIYYLSLKSKTKVFKTKKIIVLK